MGVFALGHADEPFRYVGGDISLLPTYEAAGSKYYTNSGVPVNDVLKFCYDEGMNCMRVRLFVNPSDYPNNDPNACQDLDYILPLCKRIQEDGFALMLDFHYSDTWADPAAQWTPKAWEGLDDAALAAQLYDYTKGTLMTLKENGVVPEFIQPGNEISYGMLWGPAGTNKPKKIYPTSTNEEWQRLGNLLGSAIKACREVCPKAEIVIHTERVAQVNVLTGFYNQMKRMEVDYDIIGLSYYPYYHGKISVLNAALATLEKQYPEKEIMIVETGYTYAWEVPGTNQSVDYPYTEAGQNQFAQSLVNTLLAHPNCTGLFWWWMEYNAYGSGLSNWYNAPLFDSRNGRALKALATICSFGSGHISTGVENIEAVEAAEPDARWFDLTGRRIERPAMPGLYIHGGKTVYVRP